MLRTLPERFAYKVAAIGEAKNLETMKLEELIGSLRTFEMELEENKKQRKTTMVFQIEPQQVEKEEGDDLIESMALLTKNFNQVVKKNEQGIKRYLSTQKYNFCL